MTKPILFLDIDDTLIIFRGKFPKAAPKAEEFLEWAFENFRVRPLTSWCPIGFLVPESKIELQAIIPVRSELLDSFINPNSWRNFKTEALDWAELATNNWIWLEDDLLKGERQILKEHNSLGNWIPCNVTANPLRLQKVWEILKTKVEKWNANVPPLS